jgi:hypothetical protein
MPNYQDGKIYKLVNTESTLTYIGSTTQTLAQRKAKHHSEYKRWNNGKAKYVTSFKVFDDDEFGCQIILLEAFPCNSKMELEKRERYYIESIYCINKNRPTRTDKEYYNDNKDSIRENQKEYYEEYKNKICENQKEYYEDNKIKILEKMKIRHNCICGSAYNHGDKSKHMKTLKHQKYINSIKPQQDA